MQSTTGVTIITHTQEAATRPGRLMWRRSSTGSTRRKASVSITMMASPSQGLMAAESGGTASPMKIEAAASECAVAAGQTEQGRGQADKLHVWKNSRLKPLIATSARAIHI